MTQQNNNESGSGSAVERLVMPSEDTLKSVITKLNSAFDSELYEKEEFVLNLFGYKRMLNEN